MAITRKKPVIRTYTGREVNPVNVSIEEIDIHDIAHALSQINRFGGHTRRPLNVAQHSVYVSRLVEDQGYGDLIALQGLLHDATEAYLGDITKWLKAHESFAMYRMIENKLEKRIFSRFGLPRSMHKAVKWADSIMVRFEGERGFGHHDKLDVGPFRIDHKDYPLLTRPEKAMVGKWAPWSPVASEMIFLDRFNILRNAVRGS